MSTLAKATGLLVTKAAANLPQTATATLFTVSGGAVLVRAVYGLVTTAIQNQACTLALGNTPTGGANSNATIATAGSIINKPVGTLYVPVFASNVAGAPIVANVVQPQDPQIGFIVPAGVITWTTSASNTGQMAWSLLYSPIDAGATVS